MFPNDLRKGDKVLYNGPMGIVESEIIDNRKGIRRMIDTPNVNGGRDMGDVYVWYLFTLSGTALELTPAHAKQKSSIVASGFG